MIELDPRPRNFVDNWDTQGNQEKLRDAGLSYWHFVEHDFKIDPPRRPIDLKRWLHARMLRWRFLRWRNWKLEFAKATKDLKQPRPYIAAWFFKKFAPNKVAEIRVYCKKLKHKREERKVIYETTTKIKREFEHEAYHEILINE